MGGGEDEIWGEIDAEVRLRPYSKAPKRAPRTVLLGPPGSDNKMYAEKLADSLGAVVVDGVVLQKEDGLTEEGEDLLAEAVFSRLSQNDCRQSGWVLTNFPQTPEQAQSLMESEFAPIRVIRKRLKRNAVDIPQYVQVRYQKFMMDIDYIFETICRGGNGAKVLAEGDAREVSDIIAEFVERPLSFELLNV